MEISSASLIYFSPTGATHKILLSVMRGLGIAVRQRLDITAPEVRSAAPAPIQGELVLIGVPVYAMGVPRLVVPYLRQLKGQGRPAVLIVVYGNADEGTALEELSGLAQRAGLITIAGGAFIGEHTLSTKETPMALGRPDSADLQQAEAIGQKIREKIGALPTLASAPVIISRSHNIIMGKILPRIRQRVRRNDSVKMATLTPAADPSRCSRCGVCACHCPMGAIDRDSLVINEKLCFHCFSCVKRCPKQARMIAYRPKFLVWGVMLAKTRAPKAPKVYL